MTVLSALLYLPESRMNMVAQGIIAALCQSFFAWRIRALTKSNIATAAVVLPTIVGLGSSPFLLVSLSYAKDFLCSWFDSVWCWTLQTFIYFQFGSLQGKIHYFHSGLMAVNACSFMITVLGAPLAIWSYNRRRYHYSHSCHLSVRTDAFSSHLSV